MDRNFSLSSAAVSDRGLSEKRPQNEDSFIEMGQCGIYAVADGVGGAQAGDVASQMAVEILAEAFANIKDGDDAESVMRVAIERANSAIHQMALELPQLASMATTIVALHLADNIATIGHVGDSRLYRVDRDGNLFRETDDHSVVAEEVRAGRMTEEQADNHPNRNVISRALGADSTVDIDLKTIMVEPGTAFLICSDGITRHVDDTEIKGVLTFGGHPGEICEYLKGLCYDRGAEDNLTAVVVKFSDVKTPEAETLSLLDQDDPTVTSVRSHMDNPWVADETEEILELETGGLTFPDSDPGSLEQDADERGPGQPEVQSPEFDQETDEVIRDDQVLQVSERSETERIPDETFSMFNESGEPAFEPERSTSFGRILGLLGLLLLGSAIGLGVYHFALLPPPPAVLNDQKLSVMKSEDIAFSSFEKNRRNVDADPTAYLKELPPPEGAEDFYLIGRANLLVGDYAKASLALIEAQKLIATAEPANAKILKTDITAALIIANDQTLHMRFKTELNANTVPTDPVNVNR